MCCEHVIPQITRPQVMWHMLLVSHTDVSGVWSQTKLAWVPGGEGGTDSSETDNDRSSSPLTSTYLPDGELCHFGDLCLKSLRAHTNRNTRTLTHFIPALLQIPPVSVVRSAAHWREARKGLCRRSEEFYHIFPLVSMSTEQRSSTGGSQTLRGLQRDCIGQRYLFSPNFVYNTLN